MPDTMLWGAVNHDGTVAGGTGFSCVRTATGT